MSEETAKGGEDNEVDASAPGEAEASASAGDAIEISFDDVKTAIHPVKDPEIGVSIVELGLIYGHEWDAAAKKLKVIMTLTSQMCPVGPELVAGVKMMAEQMQDVEEAEVDLVWSPAWDPKIHCSDDAKATLGIWDDE